MYDTLSLFFFQSLAKGLQDLLEYDGDVEETFMHSMQISYKDVFGSTLTHQLKENGDQIPITNANRKVSK